MKSYENKSTFSHFEQRYRKERGNEGILTTVVNILEVLYDEIYRPKLQRSFYLKSSPQRLEVKRDHAHEQRKREV